MQKQSHKEDQRTLTKQEQLRKERFEEKRAQMEEEGYQTHDLTISIAYANVMALVLGFVFATPLAIVFFLRNPLQPSSFDLNLSTLGLLCLGAIAALMALVVLHELIHGAAWAVFAPNHWRAISFGFIAKYLTPYCTCSDALNKWEYIVGGTMPLLLLGIVPSIVAIFLGSGWLFLMGIFMVFAAGGDLTIVLGLLRFDSKGKEVRFLDHPYKGGLVAFSRCM